MAIDALVVGLEISRDSAKRIWTSFPSNARQKLLEAILEDPESPDFKRPGNLEARTTLRVQKLALYRKALEHCRDLLNLPDTSALTAVPSALERKIAVMQGTTSLSQGLVLSEMKAGSACFELLCRCRDILDMHCDKDLNEVPAVLKRRLRERAHDIKEAEGYHKALAQIASATGYISEKDDGPIGDFVARLHRMHCKLSRLVDQFFTHRDAGRLEEETARLLVDEATPIDRYIEKYEQKQPTPEKPKPRKATPDWLL